MLRLLRIEWKKIFFHKGNRVSYLLYFIMIIGIILFMPYIKPNINGENIDLIQFGLFNTPYIWNNIAYIMSFGKILLAIIVISNITMEFNHGTYKQNIIDGFSKKEFFISKWLSSLFLSFFSVLLVGITTFIVAKTYNPFNGIFKNSTYIFALFIEYIAYISLAFFLAFLFKRSIFAILGLFVWSILEGVIQIIEFLFRKLNPSKFEELGTLSSYLPLKANGNIVNLPKFDLVQYLTIGSIFKETSVNYSYIITSIIYFLIFSFLTYLLIKKRDA